MSDPQQEQRHTPGPWQVAEPHKGYVQVIGNIDGDANDDGSLRVIYTHVCDVIDNDDETANAHLIAAAPDLLAALESVIGEWREGYGLNCVEQVRSAIHKAKGA